MIEAAKLDGQDGGQIAVTLRAATATETFTLLCRAYALSARERQVVAALLAGQVVSGSCRSKTSSNPSMSSICWPTCRNPSERTRARDGAFCGPIEATQVRARPVAHAQSRSARIPSRA
jgi:hypothetical protein